MTKYPLFWCLKTDQQAKLMQFYYDKYGEILDIPKPPQTAQSVWLTVQMESSKEIDHLMRQAPSHQKRIK